MTSFDGIETLHMSGTRAVFLASANNRPAQDELASALADNGLELQVYEQVTRPRAGGVVRVGAGVP